MRIVVIGAGEVGSTAAADLAPNHEVVVIDRDGDRVESIQYEADVLGVEGDGTDADVLREAGIDRADILIASTDVDETNVVACATAKAVADPLTIARVRKPTLLRTWEQAKGVFGVDHMVSVDLLTARTIVQIAGLAGATDVDSFAGGMVRTAQFEVTETSPVAGRTVREADRYDRLTFAALLRANGDDREVIIPDGETTLLAGDDLVVIGTAESCRQFAAQLTPDSALQSGDDVVIAGGGSVGFQTARLLCEAGYHPRVIEYDADRAREIAEQLPAATVLEHDVTDASFLSREHVGDASLLIATLDTDERNLLAALLATRAGVDRTVAVVGTPQYADLFEAVGVDVAVNPRTATAEEITRFTRENRAENVAIVADDLAEVIEVEVDADSVLAGRTIVEVAPELPDGLVIGAIVRGTDGNRSFVTPRGNTRVEVGDNVVVLVSADCYDEVDGLL